MDAAPIADPDQALQVCLAAHRHTPVADIGRLELVGFRSAEVRPIELNSYGRCRCNTAALAWR